VIAEGRAVDAALEAIVCRWSGASPTELARHPVARRSDGAWEAAADPATGERYLGLEWDEPRDVRRVVVAPVGDTRLVRVDYWRHTWPTPAPERRPGARRGWIGQDDPWHGGWTSAVAALADDGDTTTATFAPLDFPEVPDARQLEEAEHYAAPFRRTLKLRLVLDGPAPALRDVRAETGGVWRRAGFDVLLGCGRGEDAAWDGRATAVVGAVRGARLRDAAAKADGAWRTAGRTVAVRLDVLYADSSSPLDRTVVTVRTGPASFSFEPADVLANGPLLLADLGAYVAPAGGPSYDDYRQRIAPLAGRAIHDRVAREPEQTVARAFAEIPPPRTTKQEPLPRYLPLGWEANRQEFALLYNGDVLLDKRALKVGGADTARLLWPGVSLRYRFWTGDPPSPRSGEDDVAQRLADGHLPVVVSTWQDRELLYEQTAFAAPIETLPDDPLALRGDEELALLLRFRVRNRTEGPKQARLWLATEPFEELTLEGGALLARGRIVPAEPVEREWRVQPYPHAALRAHLDAGGEGAWSVVPAPVEGAPRAVAGAALYETDLPGLGERAVVVRIPFASIGAAGARELDFEAKLAEVVGYWRRVLEAGAQLSVPDPAVDALYRAVLPHVAITVDRDPATGLYMVPAATYSYGTCANESCLQIRQLDWRGYHERARAYLETFLRTQGWRGLDGRFGSAEGALRGLDVYGAEVRTHFNYNLDHGFVMRQLAEHYWLTDDREWARRWAGSFVAACDFVVREREATKQTGPDGEPAPEYGLLPAGHLEDNQEWRHWFAVNAWAYGGLRDLAGVLAEIGQPDAARLVAEAERYAADVRAAVARARERSPVVRLRDGTAVPHTPTRTGLRGRAWGWFREGAYGPLHLVDNDLLDPGSREVGWILRDLEDNVFVTRQYGWPVDVERDWFSQGGIAVQANLLNNALAYLRRGQTEHAVRALLNNLGANLFRDVSCFAEHPVVALGHGVGPFYKTPDECGFLNTLRQFLLYEEGPTLRLAWGAPRSWLRDGAELRVERMATRFGPTSYRLRSHAAEGRIVAEIEPPRRRPPREVELHLRHPTGAPVRAVRVEGAGAHEVDAARERVVLRGGEQIVVEARY
jgi:hypothetical protein